MDEIQLLKSYQFYRKAHGLQPLTCEFDDLHGELYVSLDNDFQAYLFCISCNYKYFPGTETLREVAEYVYAHIVKHK